MDIINELRALQLIIREDGMILGNFTRRVDRLSVLAINASLKDFTTIKGMINELYLIAVRQNGLSLQFIKKQTPEIRQYAIAQNPEAAQYVDQKIDNPIL